MNIWNFSNENFKLYNELKKIDFSVEDILTQTFHKINEYEPRVLSFWIEEGLKSKVDTYLLRYVIPLYELLKEQGREIIFDSLIIQLFSCISWRTFDNCVDNHVSQSSGHQKSLIALMYLFDYTKLSSQKNILPAIELHFKTMAEQSVIEKSTPINLNDIWKRCSIMLFAVENSSKVNKESVELYKQYINYSGLAHDTHDFFSDIAGNTISLPVYWMKQLNPDQILSINTVKLLYHRVRQEVEALENVFKKMEVEKRFPLINHMLKESWQTFHDE